MPPLPPVTLHYPAFIPAAVYADGNEAVAAAAASADSLAFFNKNSLITFVWPLTFVAPSGPPPRPHPPPLTPPVIMQRWQRVTLRR